MKKNEQKKLNRIVWAVLLIPLIVGLILLSVSSEVTAYSTNEYWVSKDYHHVYNSYSGEIVDYIEDDEICKIKDDQIIVEKRSGGYLWGQILSGIFGFATVSWIVILIFTSDDWKKWKQRHNFET